MAAQTKPEDRAVGRLDPEAERKRFDERGVAAGKLERAGRACVSKLVNEETSVPRAGGVVGGVICGEAGARD
jgi:hypothetical protein